MSQYMNDLLLNNLIDLKGVRMNCIVQFIVDLFSFQYRFSLLCSFQEVQEGARKVRIHHTSSFDGRT